MRWVTSIWNWVASFGRTPPPKQSKDLHYYMSLPYTVAVEQDEEGGFVARIVELRGCVAHGRTEEEATTLLTEVQEIWLLDALGSGAAIPEPLQE